MMMSPITPATAAPVSTPGEAEFRQLRHQTKNALQRIMCQIAACRDLQATPQGARLVDDLERRVRLSSAVSDALFGVTSQPGPLADRLRRMSTATIGLIGDPDQLLTLEVACDPGVHRYLHDTVLRIVHEFVGNAVKHGLYARSIGSITVRVTQEGRRVTRIAVVDDGWGFACTPEAGEGSRLAAIMAERHGGTTALTRRGGVTVAEAMLQSQ